MELSVIVPVCNEAPVLEAFLARLGAAELPGPAEVLLVDDGSTDGSAAILRAFAVARRAEPTPGRRVVLLAHGTNRGKGAAVATALARATGRIVAIQDADLEYDPRELAGLVERVRAGSADVAFGNRFARGRPAGMRRLLYLGNRGLTLLANALAGRHLTDMETCYKVFRRSLLPPASALRSRSFDVEIELALRLAWAGARFAEVPLGRYSPRGRAEGKKIGVRHGLLTVWRAATLVLERWAGGSA